GPAPLDPPVAWSILPSFPCQNKSPHPARDEALLALPPLFRGAPKPRPRPSATGRCRSAPVTGSFRPPLLSARRTDFVPGTEFAAASRGGFSACSGHWLAPTANSLAPAVMRTRSRRRCWSGQEIHCDYPVYAQNPGVVKPGSSFRLHNGFKIARVEHVPVLLLEQFQLGLHQRAEPGAVDGRLLLHLLDLKSDLPRFRQRLVDDAVGVLFRFLDDQLGFLFRVVLQLVGGLLGHDDGLAQRLFNVEEMVQLLLKLLHLALLFLVV